MDNYLLLHPPYAQPRLRTGAGNVHSGLRDSNQISDPGREAQALMRPFQVFYLLAARGKRTRPHHRRKSLRERAYGISTPEGGA